MVLNNNHAEKLLIRWRRKKNYYEYTDEIFLFSCVKVHYFTYTYFTCYYNADEEVSGK